MNTITADQIQQGDKIKVTRVEQDGDRKSTRIYEGVAHEFDALYGFWRTEDAWNLFTDKSNAVIELLDRPKPKIIVPTLPNAVVTYLHGWTSGLYSGRLAKRTAVRDASETGGWIAYGDDGLRMNGFGSDEYFSQSLSERESMHDFKVLFAGVAK